MTKKHNWDVVVQQDNEPRIAAPHGRNPDNPSDRTPGAPTEQRLEINHDGVANTLTSVQKDNLVIPANTKKGFEEVEAGDSINFSVPNSKTRRGRVGKGKAQTLDTQCNQAVMIQKDYTKGNAQGERVYDPEGISCTLSSGGCGLGGKTGLYEVDASIRRLTEIECERLQGLPDNWTKFGNYDGAVKEISSTQRYKMIGNGVSIPVVKCIGEALLKVI